MAAGDYGVTDGNGWCPGGGFQGQFPAASPWVTAVGGLAGGKDQAVWPPSGGGFSTVWPRPGFQAAAVEAWLADAGAGADPAWLARFNASKRGFPDVSLQAVDYETVVGGAVEQVDGTSAACPAAAGMLSLLNGRRLARGKPALGWLNPLLYRHPEAFDDVTLGANSAHPQPGDTPPWPGADPGVPGGHANGWGCGPSGFRAAKGWDPASGLGRLVL